MRVDLTSQLCFCFIRVFWKGLGIDRVVDLAINTIVLMGTDVVVGFFRLSL